MPSSDDERPAIAGNQRIDLGPTFQMFEAASRAARSAFGGMLPIVGGQPQANGSASPESHRLRIQRRMEQSRHRRENSLRRRKLEYEAQAARELFLLRQDERRKLHQQPAPEAVNEGAVAGSEVFPLRKPKRSTVAGEARAKLIAKLTEHHRYADDSCLNDAPIKNNELARAVGVSISTASTFFKEKFGGWPQYRVICGNKEKLIAALKLLNGEFTPRALLRADVAG